MARFLVLIAVCVAASPASAQTFYTPAPSFSGPHPAVVRIVAPERDGTSYGSGSLVAVNESSGLVVTNWHVVRDATGPIVVHFPDGFHSGAYLLRTDRDWDLAALAIRRPNVQPMRLSTQAPQPGEALTIAGYGSGSYRSVTGQCTQYVSPGGNQPYEMIELSAPARNGDSGGPILNNRGELAGVLFGSAFGRTTGSYCGRLQWFLNSANTDFQRVSAQAMIAQQSRVNATPVVAINTINAAAKPITENRPTNPADATIGGYANAAGATVAERTDGRSMVNGGNGQLLANTQPNVQHSTLPPAATLASAAPDITQLSAAPTASLPATPVGQLARVDQIRAILALIGAAALLYHAVRFLGWAVG